MRDVEAGRGPDGHVLVAVGASGVPEAALTYAVTEASRAGVGVHLVHVVPALGDVPAEERSRLETVGTYRLQIATRCARERSGGAVEVTSATAHGPVVEALLGASSSARLVVIERPALVVLERDPAPSVTRGLAARAAAPVVTVPAVWRGPEADRAGSWTARRDRAPEEPRPPVVVASIDDPSHSRVVIGAAMAASESLDARLRFVHSWWHADGEAEPVDGVDDQVLSPRRAAEVLVEVSRGSELIVTARRAGEDDARALSPATRAALYEAACPVLVVADSQPTQVLASRRRLRLVRGA
ncbi:universal stress protein [Nocardioides sp.]|uniref:universal stress protein n=1 Tax=Nocardioides sp. TaxID=35761 RepID=UPI00321936DD